MGGVVFEMWGPRGEGWGSSVGLCMFDVGVWWKGLDWTHAG